MADFSSIDELVEFAACELIWKNSLDEIEAVLVQKGTSESDAVRLTLFIPSAFAREVYEPQGIKFPDQFYVGAQGRYEQRHYADEDIYLSARRLAKRWLAEGRPSVVNRVIDWSSEADSLRSAWEQGLTPTHIDIVHHGLLD